MYGPTETTIWSTTQAVGQDGRTVPIGRPIANTEIHILDRHLQPVPIGVAGELFIGGAGVVRGYLDRPGLTAERFLPHPFSGEPGARLYRTGDLARYLPDGNIEFLGRLDYQVKIRGHRVELGEIETVLEQHPAVREAVSQVREDGSNDRSLVAYLIPKQPSVPLNSAIRDFLKEKLPEYMVPSAFVWLDALPLTPNGKVDRSALPAPEQVRPELEATFVAPRDALEEVLAGIWTNVLGIERVGIYDNFFELGGHSLSAIRLISHVRDVFKVDLSLRTLFAAATVAEMSQAVMAHEVKPGQAQAVARVVKRVEGMSADEVRQMLQEKKGVLRAQ